MNNWMTRTYQNVMSLGSKAIPWREPELTVAQGGLLKSVDYILDEKMHQLTIVTDLGVLETGGIQPLFDRLDTLGIDYLVYTDINPNPSIQEIEQLLIAHNSNYSTGFVAIGGGSVIDAAKAAAVLKAYPQKDLSETSGLFKVRKTLQPIIAIPTTAGTGSEATIASVVSEEETKKKYAIMSTPLMPKYAILDAELTKTLPKGLTAETGMDALTHAVEAYINNHNTDYTREHALEAIQLINEYLVKSYNEPENLEYREKMLKAAYYAGAAFTRAYVGNVHAISHALTAYYGVPHGRTNATVLPVVLRKYGNAVEGKLSELATLVGVGNSAEEFIQWVETLNQTFGIPTTIPEIDEINMLAIARQAGDEANPLYPVPVIFGEEVFVSVLRELKGSEEA